MKGITPIVATVLLLLITIAIVGFASGFFQRAFTTSTLQTQEELERLAQTTGQTFKIENAKDTVITIRSTGTAALNTTTLSVYVNDVPTTCTWAGAAISPGQIAACTLAPADDCTGKSVRVVGAAAQDRVTCS